METKLIKIQNCARCGGDHEVDFRHFRGNPFVDADDIVYEWWGLCSNTGDPVLLTNKAPYLGEVIPDEELPDVIKSYGVVRVMDINEKVAGYIHPDYTNVEPSGYGIHIDIKSDGTGLYEVIDPPTP